MVMGNYDNGGPGTGLSNLALLGAFAGGFAVTGLSAVGAFNLVREHFGTSLLADAGGVALAGAVAYPIFKTTGALSIASFMTDDALRARTVYLRGQGRLNTNVDFYTRSIVVSALATGLISQAFDAPVGLITAGVTGAALGIGTYRFGAARRTA